jgi:sugar phosphate permease
MFYGWVNVAICLIAVLTGIGSTSVAYNMMSLSMAAGLGVTLSALAIGMTCTHVITGFCQPITAYITARFGARKAMLTGSVILMASCLLMAFVVDKIWLFYVIYATGMPLTVTLMGFVPSQALLAKWFFKFRGTAIAISLTSVGFASLVFAPVLTRVLGPDGDWQRCWLYILGLAVINFILIFIFIRDERRPGENFDGAEAEPEKLAGQEQTKAKAPVRVHKTLDNWTRAQVFRTPTFWMLVVVGVALYFVGNIMIATLAPYLILTTTEAGLLTRDAAMTMAAAAVSAYGITSIPTRLAAGFVIDRIEPKFVYIFGLCVSLTGMLLIVTMPMNGIFAAVLVAMGQSIAMICPTNMLVNYFGRKEYPHINGIYDMCIAVPAGFATFIMATINDITGSFAAGFYFIMSFYVIGVIIILLLKIPKIPAHTN